VLGFLAYNYFFTEPRYTFEITRPDEFVAVTLFLVMGLAGGNLANRIRRQVSALQATNEQSRKLLLLNERLSAITNPAALRQMAAETVAELTGVPVCIVLGNDTNNPPEIAANSHRDNTPDETTRRQLFAAGREDDRSDTQVTARDQTHWHAVPLIAGDRHHGVLALRLDRLDHEPVTAELQLFAAYASQIAQALTRIGLTASLEEARVAQETERLRAALLSSVSHDLRTPLASMIGAASSLRELDSGLTESDKRELLDSVLNEGHRLDRYIENLLDMTRLGHGAFTLERDWVAPADLIAAAIRRTREQFPDLDIVHEVPSDPPLLYVHSALVEQAIFNVLENAARFSPTGCPVAIRVAAENDQLAIRITDEGQGIPPAERARVFDMFFSGADSDGQRYGSGLGLAICHGMLAAHGGSVQAYPGPGDRGTTIEMWLPIVNASSGSKEQADP
jgi:two-component system sensor histidine kinase KdpD